MSATGLSVFDRTLQATHIWLDDVMKEMGWTDRQKAYHGLRAVLHALRDRLPVTEAAQLSAQLPMLIRGFFFEGWRPSATPVKERHWDQFVAHVAEEFALDAHADAKKIVKGVFAVVNRHVGEGEVESLKQTLPHEVRELWPAAKK